MEDIKSLLEKTMEGAAEEEKCDILFSLANLIDESRFIGNSPKEVLLDREGTPLESRAKPGGNLAFWPPEAIRSGLPLKPDKPHQWFLLGMFAYFLYYKTDYYSRKGLTALELAEHADRRSCVIMPEDTGEIPFGRAVSQLTAVDPGKREEGLVSFLKYLAEKMPETAEIRYTCGGRVVGAETRTLSGRSIENLHPTGVVTLGGESYVPVTQPVQIPYRPGRHRYEVPVGQFSETGPWVYSCGTAPAGSVQALFHRFLCLNWDGGSNRLDLLPGLDACQFRVFQVGADRKPRCVEQFTVRRPATVSAYRKCCVSLRYDMAGRRLLVSVLDEDEKMLAPQKFILLGGRV